MINTVTLVGRITRDPELRKTGTDKSVVNFTLAVNRQFNREETDFIQVVTWNQSADFVANYVNKGDLLGVVGRIETGSYEDRETGKTIYTTEVVANSVQALESRSEKESRQSEPQERTGFESQERKPAQPTYMNPEPVMEKEEQPIIDITSDDLPF